MSEAAQPHGGSRLVEDHRIIACIPALAVLFDYSMTLIFSGGREVLLRFEFSPFVRYAVGHDIMAVYLLAMMLFYCGMSFAALRLLRPTGLYRFGVAFVLLISAAHLLGGLVVGRPERGLLPRRPRRLHRRRRPGACGIQVRRPAAPGSRVGL